MSVKFLHRGAADEGPVETQPTPEDPEPQRPTTDLMIDWRGVRRADHACCCTAKPAVIVIMPPTADRPHPTDLLLCGHHYRASRQHLAAANATILDLRGAPITDGAWPGADSDG